MTVGERRYELGADDRLTFGRARDRTICLDPADRTISRRAGSLESDQGTWWLTNRSDYWSLSIIDAIGFRSVLAPGRRIAVEAPTQVVVAGRRREHALRIEPAVTRLPGSESEVGGVSTAIGQSVLVNPAERLAMLALFAGYLLDPLRYDPYPRTYESATRRLGWRPNQVRKRIEYLRARLARAGVPNLAGGSALANLAEYALSRGLITKADLPDLYRDSPPAGRP